MENRPKYEGEDHTVKNEPVIENPILKRKYELLCKKLQKEQMLTGEDVRDYAEIGVCKRASYVYIIGSDDYDYKKIGVATHVFSRLADLQVGNPFDLKLEAIILQKNAFELEKILHKRFSDYKVRGEWFEVTTDKIIEVVRRMI